MAFHRSILLLSLCGVLSLSLAACDNPEQKEARHIKRGNALLEKGELEKARVEYKNALALKPTEAEPYYRLGLTDEEDGDLRNAFANFTTAEQQNSHYIPAVLKIAQYYMAAEQYGETRRRLDAVLETNPDNVEAHALSAAMALREKKLDAAETEAAAAHAKDPANITACSALAGVFVAKGDIEQAVAVVDDGIVRNPKSVALHLLRVYIYQQKNDLTKVAESYRALFAMKPDVLQFREDLATLYVKDGKIDEAEAVMREGVTAHPKNWDMKHQLAIFLDQHRDIDTAEKEIRTLMAQNPDREDPYFWLADLYARHNSTDRAITLLEQIVQRGSFDPPALNARAMLAGLHVGKGNTDLAQKLVATVLAKAPDNRAALYIRANLSYNNGYYQSASSDLRSILRNAPKDGEALQLLGETLLAQGHLDLAIDTLKKLADIDPMNLAARVRLAQIVQQNGDAKQALQIVSIVTDISPQYAVAWETAARIAIADKQWLPAQAAIRALDRLENQHMTATFLEGQIFDAAGKRDEAITKYTTIINADPTTPLAEHALDALIDDYAAENKIATAANYLTTLKTETPYILTALAKCYAVTGKLADAATAYDKAIEAHPTQQEPYIDRAKLYLADHKNAEAQDILQKAAAALPGDLRASILLAGLMGDAGKYQEAIALYTDILTRDPGQVAAANNLAAIIADYQYNDASALEKARQTAERFSGSSDPILLDTLAWVYYRQGNAPLAQTLISRAMSMAKTELPPQIHYHYAVILLANGKSEQGKAELTRAVTDAQPYPGLEDARKLLATH